MNAGAGALVVQITPDPALTAPIRLTVTANIVVETRGAALSVPRAALLAGTCEPAARVLDGTIVHKRAITVVGWPAARLIVTLGLVASDKPIADATGLADGQTVKLLAN